MHMHETYNSLNDGDVESKYINKLVHDWAIPSFKYIGGSLFNTDLIIIITLHTLIERVQYYPTNKTLYMVVCFSKQTETPPWKQYRIEWVHNRDAHDIIDEVTCATEKALLQAVHHFKGTLKIECTPNGWAVSRNIQ